MRGSPLSTKRAESAASNSSGVPIPTKPEVARVSPGRITATASWAETILLRMHAVCAIRAECESAGPALPKAAGYASDFGTVGQGDRAAEGLEIGLARDEAGGVLLDRGELLLGRGNADDVVRRPPSPQGIDVAWQQFHARCFQLDHETTSASAARAAMACLACCITKLGATSFSM